MLSLCVSVSVSELQSHAELDPDADGTLTETEAQVFLHFSVKLHQPLNLGSYAVQKSPGLGKYGKKKTEYGNMFVFPNYCPIQFSEI